MDKTIKTQDFTLIFDYAYVFPNIFQVQTADVCICQIGDFRTENYKGNFYSP